MLIRRTSLRKCLLCIGGSRRLSSVIRLACPAQLILRFRPSDINRSPTVYILDQSGRVSLR
jgi:hypothetical protein